VVVSNASSSLKFDKTGKEMHRKYRKLYKVR
jgi:hypothetical protein